MIISNVFFSSSGQELYALASMRKDQCVIFIVTINNQCNTVRVCKFRTTLQPPVIIVYNADNIFCISKNFVSYTQIVYFDSYNTLIEMTCLVSGCKSNYHTQADDVPMFSFTIDEETRQKQFRAILRRRKDYELNKRLEVRYYDRLHYNW